ncbi:MAG: DNRLRE domain-containing protein [Planctomycetes bacterium]|nr:DNRLRE domain-containing protein [Planctomycetota bacterium]
MLPSRTPRAPIAAALTLLLAAGADLAAQTTVTIPCAADNTLYEDVAGSVSNGKGSGIFVGVNGIGMKLRTVLRFDVAAALPANASIVSARLTVQSTQSQYTPSLAVTGHRLLQDWGEGNSIAPAGGGFGGSSSPGDATWIHTFYPGSFWTNAGGDFAPASFTISMPRLGVAQSSATPDAVADVQFWLDNPAQNFGWLLKTNEAVVGAARRLASRESATGTKPTLTVQYVVPGQTGVWGTGCPTVFGTHTFQYVGGMIGGNTIQLLHTNAPPNSVGINYFALELFQPGGLLQPSCNLYLPATQSWIPGLVFLTDGAGTGSSFWPVPAIYPDLYFVTQSAVLDNSALGLALSNAGVGKIL